MNDAKTALALRAMVAIRRLGLRLLPGMRATWPDDARPCRRYGSPGETGGWVSDYSGNERFNSDEDALPDLADPATLGCLLALVREAWGDPVADVRYRGEGEDWACRCQSQSWFDPDITGATQAEALVAALEAAPPKHEG